MPPLKNSRHEKFALASFQGKTGKDAAIQAGYIYKNENTIKATASRLLTYVNITRRIQKLHEKAESPTIMSVKERRERLSELSRARLVDFIDEEGNITLEAPNSGALQEVVVTEWQGGKDERASSRNTRVKLHNPITSIAELNKMGGDYPPSKVELEPGKELGAALSALLERLRGYSKE